jgi:hypothetical protein
MSEKNQTAAVNLKKKIGRTSSPRAGRPAHKILYRGDGNRVLMIDAEGNILFDGKRI